MEDRREGGTDGAAGTDGAGGTDGAAGMDGAASSLGGMTTPAGPRGEMGDDTGAPRGIPDHEARQRRGAGVLALASTLTGAALVAVLIFGLTLRLSEWDAWAYVSLLHGATILAILAVAVLLRARRRAEVLPFEGLVRAVSIPLMLAIGVGQLYIASATMRDLVGWLYRHLYLLRLH